MLEKSPYPFVSSGNKLLVLDSCTGEYKEYTERIPGLSITGKACNSQILLDDISLFRDAHIEVNGENHLIRVGGRMDGSSATRIQTTYWFLGYHDCVLEIGKDIIMTGITSISLVEPYACCRIGDHCRIASGTHIYASDAHPIVDVQTGRVLNYGAGRRPLEIGNRCWVGLNSMILKNAGLPDDSIVGAASVVTRKFQESYTVIAGNPAKVMKRNVKRMNSWTEVELPSENFSSES